MKIREIIVVEGKDDTVAVRRALDVDTIETNGSAINEQTIKRIKLAQETRGVIIFTDPDYPGEKIRNTIDQQVPGCKHAFLPKGEAIHKYGKGVGVEHATVESIRNALRNAHLMQEAITEQITKEDLLTAGLIAGKGSREKRERLGEILKIGYTNGKQLHKRLLMFQVSKESFAQALMMLESGGIK